MTAAVVILRNNLVNNFLEEFALAMRPFSEEEAEDYGKEVTLAKMRIFSEGKDPDFETMIEFGDDFAGFQSWKMTNFSHGKDVYVFRYYDRTDQDGEYHLGKGLG